jgi:hypothetical protein
MEWRIRENRESRETSDLDRIRKRMREIIEELETEDDARVTAQEIVGDASEELREKEVDENQSIDKRVEAALDAIEAEEDFEKRKRRAIESLKENLIELSHVATEKDVADEAVEVPRVGTVRSVEGLDEVLDKHMELKLRRGFEKEHQEVVEYLNGDREQESTIEKPPLIEKIEQLEMKRLYEDAHGTPPDVSFESMQDIDRLLKEHSDKLPDISKSKYRQCEVYFEVKGDWSKTRKELSEAYGICHGYMGDWRAGKDTPLMARLRELEEERICREWAKSSEAHDFANSLKSSSSEQKSTWEQTSLEELSRYRVSGERVQGQFETLTEVESWTNENLASVIKELCNESPRGFVRYAELNDTGWDKQRIRDLQGHIRSNQKELQAVVGQELDKSKFETLKLAAIDERLYVWKVKTRDDELIGAYENQYFYFKNKGDIAKIVGDLQNRFQIEGSMYEAHKHSNRLLRELLSNDEVKIRGEPLNKEGQRLEGRVLRAYLDVMDMKLSDLEGRIVKITGPNGQAGIENPRFPEGEELEVLKARLAAIIASDCHLRESGRITYNEEHIERVDRVQDILGNLGDFKLEAKFRKGVYEVHIQNQIGLMMIHEGMTPGNKTLQNPGLPDGFLNWSEMARRAYLEELIPEDGSFSKSRGFLWFRNHALYDKEANGRNGFQSVISEKDVQLVREMGNESKGLIDQYELAFGELEKLQWSSHIEHSQAAKKLVTAISDSPNNLIEDEKKLAESLGLQITLSTTSVKYYPKSERVSVKWTAATSTKEDAEHWMDICPPNDDRKRSDAESWRRERSEKRKQNRLN